MTKILLFSFPCFSSSSIKKNQESIFEWTPNRMSNPEITRYLMFEHINMRFLVSECRNIGLLGFENRFCIRIKEELKKHEDKKYKIIILMTI